MWLFDCYLRSGRRNSKRLRQRKQRPTSRCCAIRSRRYLWKMSLILTWGWPRYLQCAPADPKRIQVHSNSSSDSCTINKSNSISWGVTSLPSGIPLPSVAVKPIALAISVRKVKYSLSTTPLKIVFISGIPEPVQQRKEVTNLSRIFPWNCSAEAS